METENITFKLESRRYIGNKNKLTDWICDILQKETQNTKSFCDIFAGTGVVSKKVSSLYDTIIINDFLYSNYVVYNSFFNREKSDLIENYIKKYNNIDPDTIPENYISINFGDKYFSKQNAKLIGFIREDIETNKNILSKTEYFTLISILMYSMDKIANTVGHYDFYLKNMEKTKPLKLQNIENIKTKKDFIIYNEDTNTLIRKIKSDIIYIDPPYNSRQYDRFYHIWENVAEWKKVELYGKSLKPITKKISKYCQTSATKTFEDLIKNADCKYLVVSYNNTYNSKSNSSRNKISLEEIEKILKNRGKTKIFYKDYKYFNTGKTKLDNHQELIFLTKVRDDK